MSLTFPHGPLSNRPSETNYDLRGPTHRLFFDDFPRRVRAFFEGHLVFDTRRGKLLHDFHNYTCRAPTSVWTCSKNPTARRIAPLQGGASYWSIRVGDRRASEAAWAYAESANPPWLRDYVAFEWNHMDAWFDEDEEVRGHLRDPHHNIDVRESSRL